MNATDPVAPPFATGDSKQMPRNEEAEAAVLACLISDYKFSFDLVQRLKIEGSFHNPAHQAIFQTILELSETHNEIDSLLLAEALKKSGKLDAVGGRSYLVRLADAAPTSANLEKYVEIVHQKAILRHMIRTCTDIASRCYDAPGDVRTLADSIENEVMKITDMHASKKTASIKDLSQKAFAHVMSLMLNKTENLGFSTGYADLDKIITGLRPGEMIVIAARPSIGKTAFALNIASNIAKNPKNPENPIPVGVFSLEMGCESLALRLLCGEARLDLSTIHGQGIQSYRLQEIGEASERLKQTPIYIDDSANIDILELRAKARRMYRENGVRCFFIDYLQLLRSDSDNRNASRENEVARISSGIKGLAKELGVPVVVLAQLNRQAEQGEEPKLSHLRESGAIEQDADIVMLLHRKRQHEISASERHKPIEASVIVAKHRNGPTGICNMLFFPQFTRFESQTHVRDDDVPNA